MPQFFDEDALARELKKRISEAFKAPGAQKVLAFTQAQRDSIAAATQVMVNGTVKKTCELFDANKRRVDDLDQRADKQREQQDTNERRLSRHGQHLAALETRLRGLETKGR